VDLEAHGFAQIDEVGLNLAFDFHCGPVGWNCFLQLVVKFDQRSDAETSILDQLEACLGRCGSKFTLTREET
jgi:hypothetical protein